MATPHPVRLRHGGLVYNGAETVLVSDGADLGVEAPAVIGFDVIATHDGTPTGAVPPVR